MSKIRNDYDSPWKEILEAYFEECMAFFFPDVHKDIDWDRGYEFLEKELQQIAREAEVGKRLADKLVKVWRKTGEQVWVLVHIEVQSQAKTAFPERMYTYNYRLRDRFRRPVASFAILSDADPSWHPQKFSAELWDCTVDFKFRTTKLLDYKEQSESLLNSSNPFAVVVVAHLKTVETNNDAFSRKKWKLKLIKLLYQKGYQREDVIRLFRFIDWLLVLPEDLDKSIWQDIIAYQEELKMPYMMSFERAAKQEGKEEGLIEGIRGAIELGLELKFGDRGLDLVGALTKTTDIEVLKQLKEDLRSDLSLSDLRTKYQ
ncbi:MAG: cytosolic protein [Cyanobacteria bacterium P01_D01_bin.36]